MRAPQWLILSVGLLLATVSAGCKAPAMIVWSPDGSAAAYRTEDTGFLIDSTGKVTAPLGRVIGGAAWSADSKTLYYAVAANLADAMTAPQDWKGTTVVRFKPSKDAPADPPAVVQPKEAVEIRSFAGGKSGPVVKFGAGKVVHLAVSPDQNWLAAVCATEASSAFAIFVYHVPSKHLYQLSDTAGLALCFTGPNRLAYIEPDRRDRQIGKVAELTLADNAAPPDRAALMDVIPTETPWIAALGENLLLTSFPRTFPGKPVAEQDMNSCKLFMWTRGNGGIVALADDVGPLFAVAPDGKRILIEKTVARTDHSPARHELQIIQANGSDGHTLRDLSRHEWFAMLPAWHGNDEITFTSSEESAKPAIVKDRACLQYDVIQYKLNDKEELEAIKTLSETWESGMKPYVVIDDGASAPTTRPTTEPTTETTKP